MKLFFFTHSSLSNFSALKVLGTRRSDTTRFFQKSTIQCYELFKQAKILKKSTSDVFKAMKHRSVSTLYHSSKHIVQARKNKVFNLKVRH